MMKKLLYAIGWLGVLVILLLVSLVIAVALSWPMWGGLVLFIAFLVLFLLMRAALLVIPKAIDSLRQLSWPWSRGSNRLEMLLWQHWWQGGRLQSWRRLRPVLQKRGRVPAWFLVLGDQDSEKNALLAESNVVPMVGQKQPFSASSNFFTCRWWFFKNAMYLITTSRFSGEQALYRQAWKRLVRWIGFVREPRGAVVCLPMEQLLQGDQRQLYANARAIRAQLELLMKRIEKRLPIWLVITRSDVLPGMTEWIDRLSVEQKAEIFGHFIDSDAENYATEALESSMQAIVQALKMVRLKLLNQQRQQPRSQMLSLPEQIEKLYPNLNCYISALFDRDPYLEHGVFRGLFFTAEYGPVSERQGIFSQRLLGELLPNRAALGEKHLMAGWRTWLKRTIVGALLVLLTYGISYALLNTWRDILQRGQLRASTPLEHSYLKFWHVEEWRQNTFSRLLFYPAVHTLEQNAAKEYQAQAPSERFSPNIIAQSLLARFQQAGAAQKRGLALNWARFIEKEQQIQNGVPLATLAQAPLYDMSVLAGEKDPLTAQQRVALRLAQYRLGKDPQQFKQWRDILQVMLTEDPNLNWLLAVQPNNVSGFTLFDFWPLADGQKIKSAVTVRPIYTREGEKVVKSDLQEIEQALARPDVFTPWQQRFEQDYQYQRQEEWLNFAQIMPQGEFLVRGRPAWQALILATSQYKSPYITFLTALENDLSTVPEEDRQKWLVDQRRLWEINTIIQKSSALQRVSLGGYSMRQRILRWLGISYPVSIRMDDNSISLYKAWRQIVQTASQRELLSAQESEQMVKEALGTAQEAAPVNNGLRALFNRFSLWRTQAENKDQEAANEILWQLYGGDARLILRYALFNSADNLQSAWENKVIWPVDKLYQQKIIGNSELKARLYQYVNSYVRETANYALKIRPEGIQPQVIERMSFPFNNAFMVYLNGIVEPNGVLSSTPEIRRRLEEKRLIMEDARNKAEEQQETKTVSSGQITLTSQPASANRDARLLPIGSSVSLFCDAGVQQFTSMNFNDTKTLRWDPQTCNKVQVDILFPNFTLHKSFFGHDALLQFIRAFSQEGRVWGADEFSSQYGLLRSLNINEISLHYIITGGQEAQKLYQQWQQQRQQQALLDKQSQHLDNQLLDLSEPSVPQGTLATLPQKITASWNELRNPASE